MFDKRTPLESAARPESQGLATEHGREGLEERSIPISPRLMALALVADAPNRQHERLLALLHDD